MCEYVKEFSIIDNNLQNKIIKYVEQYNGDFSSSLLYNRIKKKEVMYLQKRKSEFRTIIKDELFDLVDKYVELINEINDYNFMLIQDDISHIKYIKGDHFGSHEDFIKIKTNMVEDYTGIMCIKADCKGGETVFHLNKNFIHTSKASITAKHCILFRKDILHEGKLLTEGYKEIITFNLWAMPKNNNSIVIVTFDDISNDEILESKISDKDPLREKYIIPYSNVMKMDNIIQGFIRFNKLEGKKIIHYHTESVTYEEFKVIYQILMNTFTIKSKKNDAIINYYCIDNKDVLINISQFTLSLKDEHITYKIGDDIIYCTTPENTIYLTHIVKKKKLPYVPFTVIITDDNGFSNISFASLSEYNNILIDIKKISDHRQCNLHTNLHTNLKKYSVYIDMSRVLNYIISGSDKRYYEINSRESISDCPKDFSTTEWYGIDEGGRMFLGEKHCIYIDKYLLKTDFLNKIISNNKVKYMYPHDRTSYRMSEMCNMAGDTDYYDVVQIVTRMSGIIRVDEAYLD